jgi:hypothetical protein
VNSPHGLSIRSGPECFKAFISWPAILKLSMSGLGDGIFVPRTELLHHLPSWAQKVHPKFVVSGREDFDRLITEAFALDPVILVSSEGREAWADEIERDEEARETFAGYLAGRDCSSIDTGIGSIGGRMTAQSSSLLPSD